MDLSKRVLAQDYFVSMDMDETLLHTMPLEACAQIERQPDSQFKLNGQEYALFIRPGVHEMLSQLRQMARLNIFTLGARDYAHEALRLGGFLPFFERIFTREHCEYNALVLLEADLIQWRCSRKAATVLKDLRLVNHDVSRIVAIDDRINVYPMPFFRNVIPVMPYTEANPYFFRVDVEPIIENLSCLVSQKFSV